MLRIFHRTQRNARTRIESELVWFGLRVSRVYLWGIMGTFKPRGCPSWALWMGTRFPLCLVSLGWLVSWLESGSVRDFQQRINVLEIDLP